MRRIIAKRTIREFWLRYTDSKDYLETWYETAKSAKWRSPNEIREFYATVTILKGSRVVFSISGNKYRLIAKINYQKQWLFIRFIVTNQEYDKINANTI